MNNKRQRNKLFTMLMLVMAWLFPQRGWAQETSQPSVGNGSKSNPYEISTAAELAWFRDYVNGGKLPVSAKLTADIDLKDFCYAAANNAKELSWEPIGNYSKRYTGTFDGNGHTISNLYIKVQRQGVGFFGCAEGGSIKNITFDNAQVENTGNDYNYTMTGIVVGAAFATLQNLKTLKNCSVKSGAKVLGGIAGSITRSCSNLENNATVSGKYEVGGIAGRFSSDYTMSSCVNNGMVAANRSGRCGGIVGFLSFGNIEDCANYGNVTGTNEIGGIVGYAQDNSTIKRTLSSGDITSQASRAGIIVGYARSINARNMLAYSNNAKLTINGTIQEGDNIKTVGEGNLGIASGSTLEEIIKGFTQEQLKSGEVAWLLNGSTSVPTEGSTLAWYQKLGEKGDKYPVLTQKDGNTVYNKYYICVDKQVYMNIFSNMEDDVHKKYDKHDKGTETLLADGLYSYTCQRCQTDFKYIKDFCGIKGNDLELTDDNGKYIAKAVTLKDGEAYNSPVDIEVKDLKYARTYAANKWQPLYVPFAMNVDQWTGKGLTVASINNFHETKLKSGETQVLLEVKKVTSGSLEPNIPYLILCDAEGEKLLELGATTLSKAEEGSIDCHSVTRNYVFQGKYTTKNDFGASETAIYYGVKDGEMVQLTAEDVIGPQNWYLTVTNRPNLYDVDTPLTSAAKAFSIRVIGDGEATGIEDIHVISDEGENGKQGIFDLQGRKLDAEPTHGIYIKNGKKYVK